MGRRSRIVALRRKRKQILKGLIRRKAMIDGLKLDFYRETALFAKERTNEGHTAASSIAWISVNCHTTEAEAADWIALGETMLHAWPEAHQY